MVEQLANLTRTTLAEDLDNSETVVSVTSAAAWPTEGNFRVRCENELMLATSRSSNDVTVTRGIEGTTATTHANGTAISVVITKAGLLQWLQENDIGRLVLADGITDPPEPVWTQDGTDFIYEEDMD